MHYVIDNNLRTTSKQRAFSGLLASTISVLLALIMYFVHISSPNPPFENPKGELQLDFGMEEVSYGNPTDGGPSETPPAKGGDQSSAPSESSSAAPSGGHGDIVNTTDNTETQALPPIDPPASTTPAVNSRLSKMTQGLGKRGGGNENGSPKGIDGGHGSEGYGPGGNNGGITGMGGTRVTNNRGNGFFSANGFSSYLVNSDMRHIDYEGSGTIIARIRVECNGVAKFVRLEPSGNWNGTLEDARSAINDFLRTARWTKNGEKCPESGTISLNVKKGL